MLSLLEKAEAIGLNSPSIVACRELRDKVVQYNQECAEAVEAVVEGIRWGERTIF